MGWLGRRILRAQAPSMEHYASRTAENFKVHERLVFSGMSPREVDGRSLDLGTCLNDHLPVRIPLSTAHSVFVSGMPGSGKTTALLRLIAGARDSSVPILVIEGSSKAEFAGEMLPNVPHTDVLGLGSAASNVPWRWNPLAPVPGTLVGSHAADVADAILLAGDHDPEAPLPQVCHEAVLASYLAAGWSEKDVAYEDPGRPWPTVDMVDPFAVLAHSAYEDKVKGNVSQALKTRLDYVLAHRDVFCSQRPCSLRRLVGGSVVLELGSMGSRTASFAMASVLASLVEYASQLPTLRFGDAPRLMVVVDELNALLEREDPRTRTVSALLARAFREFRSKGIVFVTAAQNVDGCEAIMSNASLKIAFRCDGESDVRAVGGALGLEGDQLSALRYLPDLRAVAKLPAKNEIGVMEPVPIEVRRPDGFTRATALHAACAVCTSRLSCGKVKTRAELVASDLDDMALARLAALARKRFYDPVAMRFVADQAMVSSAGLPQDIRRCALGSVLVAHGLGFEESRSVMKVIDDERSC